MAPHVFLSHSSHDHFAAETLCTALEAEGIRCWIAPRDIPAGMEWSAAIISALRGSALLLLVVTAASSESPQVLREIERAVALRLPIVALPQGEAPQASEQTELLRAADWLEATDIPLERRLPEILARVHQKLGMADTGGSGASHSSNNLPTSLDVFVGRETELALLCDLLSPTSLPHQGIRIVTLTGMGGLGKTRLAYEAARSLFAEQPTPFPDGVYVVELAPVSDPTLVPQAVAGVLAVREEGGRTATEALIATLKEKQLLLLLDNCERIIPAVAVLTAAILRECPGVKVLATSRERLSIAGERVVVIGPLPLPPVGEEVALEIVEQSEAVRLFLRRAQAATEGFVLTPANADAVVGICRHLDGIPLAIELAAARVRSLPPHQIEQLLERRFRILTGGRRDLLPHQQTLRTLIDWSYDFLDPGEKTLLLRLSVFVGGWTLEAAETICHGETTSEIAGDGIEDWEVLDHLMSLANKSLVVAEQITSDASVSGDETMRYRLLETVRAYATERLAEKGEAETAAVRARHATFFLALAEEANQHLRGTEQIHWLGRLSAEQGNLRTALDFYSTSPEIALRFATSLGTFWTVRGHYTEGSDRLSTLLAVAARAGVSPGERAMGQILLGGMTRLRGDFSGAIPLLEEALTWARTAGKRAGIAAALESLGIIAAQRADFAHAHMLLSESLQILREEDKKTYPLQTSVLNSLGNVAFSRGEYDVAWKLYDEAVDLARACGHWNALATALANRAMLLRALEQVEASSEAFAEAITLFRKLGNLRGTANSLNNLAATVLSQERADATAKARALLEESVGILRRLGDLQALAAALNNLGSVLAPEAEVGGELKESIPTAEWASGIACIGEGIGMSARIGDIRESCHGLRVLAGTLLTTSLRALHEMGMTLDGAETVLRTPTGSVLTEREEYMRSYRLIRATATLGAESVAAAVARGEAMSLADIDAYVQDGLIDRLADFFDDARTEII